LVKKPFGFPGGFFLWVVTKRNCNRDAAMHYNENIQQFQGFIVAEMPRTRGPDTSLWSCGLLVLSRRAKAVGGKSALHVHHRGDPEDKNNGWDCKCRSFTA
jgi:hypothetical protein